MLQLFFCVCTWCVSHRRKGTFFVSQVVLTPKASTVMKGVASGLRETITERCVCLWQKHSDTAFKLILTVTREPAWHFRAKSCGVLVSRCIRRRLTPSESIDRFQLFFLLLFCEELPQTHVLFLYLLFVSDFPLASPLHLNVTSFKSEPSVYFWN